MRYINPRYDDFRYRSQNYNDNQGDNYPDVLRNDRQRERDYFVDERGHDFAANYPQYGAAVGREQGNDDYGHRHDRQGPAYGTDEFRSGSAERFPSRYPGRSEQQRYSGQPDYERHARDFYLHEQEGVGIRRSNQPGFYEGEDKEFGARRYAHAYPAHSPEYLGGAYPGGTQRGQRNWGYGFHAGEGYQTGQQSWKHDAFGTGGQSGHGTHFDPDYHQWRHEQIRNLDRDYDGWRQERFSKFSDDFNTWRGNRPGSDPAQSTESSGVSDNSHPGPASTATGIKK